MNIRCARICLVSVILVVALGCARKAHVEVGDERLNSVLWMQTSVEYTGLCEAVYQQAKQALTSALTDSSWTAATEQKPGYEKLPPAVILDIDETVLDNSGFQGSLVAAKAEYSDLEWNEWVKAEKAKFIPGAEGFIRFCDGKATVFFITSRTKDAEAATISNLGKLKIMVSPDFILSKGEQPDWGSDKKTRRDYVANSYRIVLLIGDDFGDFVSGAKDTLEKRRLIAEKHIDMWGRKWFILPNAIYGSWEMAIYGNDLTLSHEEKLRQKILAVQSYKGKKNP